jgi:hypothetical protein
MSTKERQQQALVALEAAVARLSPLPVPQLAAEVMALLKPDAPDAMPRMISAPQVALEFAPDSNMLLGLADNLNRQLQHLILEALQALEHASLVCLHFEARGIGHLGYLPTRRGLAALWYGTIEESVRASEPPGPVR